MRQLWQPPAFDSQELTERARMFHVVAWSLMVVVTGVIAIAIAVLPSMIVRGAVTIAFVDTLALCLLKLNRRGQTRAASTMLVSGLIVLTTSLAPTAGGIRAPAIAANIIVVMTAGVLLGERAGLVTGIVCIASGLGLVLAERAGILPAAIQHTPETFWLLNALIIGIGISLQRLTAATVKAALDRAGAELAERKQAERERETLVHDLGERVKELRLLHAVARLLQTGRPFNRDLLAELVALIPSAWQYPECCEARIAYEDIEVSTSGWRDSPWKQTASFVAPGGRGVIEVAYLAECPPEVEGPFLAEERALLDSLTDMLEAHTQRQRAESQLRQSQKLQALGTLSGGIAHDFNNVLAAITGNAELALTQARPDNLLRPHLEEILKAGARASDLVRRILVFSRQQETQRKAIELEPVIEEALKLLRATLPAMIHIRSSYAFDVSNVLADATQIHQIVMNLGTNAGHAMRDRGGVLSVSVDEVMMDAALADRLPDLVAGPHVRLTMSDTGCGISPEIADRIFEPFFTTKSPDAGTGLGLSVVHGIVQSHGGAISVYSDPGRGTSFTIYFPASHTSPAVANAQSIDLLMGQGERVLCVDDEEALVGMVTLMLERLGYTTTGFSDAHQALDAFRAAPHEFDAVLTDMAMPHMTGRDLAQAIRAIRSDIAVAAMSGFITREDAQAASQAGVQVMLQKPCSLHELGRALRGMLEQSPSGDLRPRQ